MVYVKNIVALALAASAVNAAPIRMQKRIAQVISDSVSTISIM
jgi:hypothetical protein